MHVPRYTSEWGAFHAVHASPKHALHGMHPVSEVSVCVGGGGTMPEEQLGCDLGVIES